MICTIRIFPEDIFSNDTTHFLFNSRDRKRIKARIAQREKRQSENKIKASIEEKEPRGLPNDAVNSVTENVSSNGRLTIGLHNTARYDENSSNSGLDHGVDNLTYEHSFVDIPLADEISETKADLSSQSKLSARTTAVSNDIVKTIKPQTANKTVPNGPKQEQISIDCSNEHKQVHITEINECKKDNVTKNDRTAQITTRHISHEKITRAVSNDSKDSRQLHLNHLPLECLAVKKLLRRHSYELAISEYSWLPDNPPTYASCVEITNNFNRGYRQKEKKYSQGFENSVFVKGDRTRSLAF